MVVLYLLDKRIDHYRSLRNNKQFLVLIDSNCVTSLSTRRYPTIRDEILEEFSFRIQDGEEFVAFINGIIFHAIRFWIAA